MSFEGTDIDHIPRVRWRSDPMLPNGLAFSRRERAAYDDFKKARISRAKRSDCNAVLGRC
jgi:hypothetical protein